MTNNSSLENKGRRVALCLLVLLALSHASQPHASASRVYERRADESRPAKNTAQTKGASVSKAADEPVRVIPAPKSLTKTGEDFALTKDVRVVLADPKSEEDRFAAQDFIDDVRETAGVTLITGTKRGRASILVGLITDRRVREAAESSGVPVPEELGEEGYVLAVNSRGVVVAGNTPAGTFYGLQTLKQVVRG